MLHATLCHHSVCRCRTCDMPPKIKTASAKRNISMKSYAFGENRSISIAKDVVTICDSETSKMIELTAQRFVTSVTSCSILKTSRRVCVSCAPVNLWISDNILEERGTWVFRPVSHAWSFVSFTCRYTVLKRNRSGPGSLFDFQNGMHLSPLCSSWYTKTSNSQTFTRVEISIRAYTWNWSAESVTRFSMVRASCAIQHACNSAHRAVLRSSFAVDNCRCWSIPFWAPYSWNWGHVATCFIA